MSSWRFDKALEDTWKFLGHLDQIISDTKPWELVKQDKNDEVFDLLYHLAEGLRHIALMIYPAMPETAEKIFAQLGLVVEDELAKPLNVLQQWVGLTVGSVIQKQDALFPRLAPPAK